MYWCSGSSEVNRHTGTIVHCREVIPLLQGVVEVQRLTDTLGVNVLFCEVGEFTIDVVEV